MAIKEGSFITIMKTLIHFDPDEKFLRYMYVAFQTVPSVKHLGITKNLSDTANFKLEDGSKPDIYLVSLQSYDTDTQNIVGRIRGGAPNATVIGFLQVDNTEVRNAARQFGCDEVFVKHQNFKEMANSIMRVVESKPVYDAFETDIDIPVLSSVHDDILNRHADQENLFEQKTIVVGSAKGGVGKTTISVELASAFAEVRKSGTDRKLKVCLVDMDLEKPDVPVALNIKQKPFTIYSWFLDIEERKKTTPLSELHYGYHEVKRWLTMTERGLHVLLGPVTPIQASQIDFESISFMITELKAMFDVVIIDVGNNTKDYTLVAYKSCDQIIFVFSQDIACLKDNHSLAITLKELEVPTTRLRGVVNKVHGNSGIAVKEVEDFITDKLGIEYLGMIPKLDLVEKARNNSEVLILSKNNEFTTSLKRVGNQIAPVFAKNIKKSKKMTKLSKESTKTPQKERKGLFARMFQ